VTTASRHLLSPNKEIKYYDNQVAEDEQFFTEALEAKKAFEKGDVASYEEVFGHSQPEL
jgi:hypothetical protein